MLADFFSILLGGTLGLLIEETADQLAGMPGPIFSTMTCLTCLAKRLETSTFCKIWPDSETVYEAGGTWEVMVASNTTATILPGLPVRRFTP